MTDSTTQRKKSLKRTSNREYQLSRYPKYTKEELRARIIKDTGRVPRYSGKTRTFYL